MKLISENIKKARFMLGLTQKDLAKLAGLQPSAISHFESNRRVPSAQNLVVLAKALNVTTDFLLGLSDLKLERIKKYILTEESTVFNGVELFRIKALKDFGNVKKNEIGGFVESERNLSQDGCAWISDDAKAYGNAKVFGKAKVFGNAQVYGSAEVCDDARVCDLGGMILL